VSLAPDALASSTIAASGFCSKGGMNLVAGRQEERFDTTLAVSLEQGGAVARNVSANGIYFVTEVPLEAGTTVNFKLDFQNFPGGPIQVNCVARVVRVEQHGAKKGVAAAIQSFEFHRLPKADGSP
jgi:hypothetical protein